MWKEQEDTDSSSTTPAQAIGTNSVPVDMGGRGSMAVVQLTTSGRVAVAAFIVCALVLLVIGASLHTFAIRYEGLGAWVLQELGAPIDVKLSLLSLGHSLWSASEGYQPFAIVCIQIVFFLVAFVVPISHLLALLTLWVVPLPKHHQKRTVRALEVLNAWSSVDVFVVSVLAGVLQLDQLVQFVIGGACDGLNVLLAGPLRAFTVGAPVCFAATTQLEPGFWLLLTAVIIYTMASAAAYLLARAVVDGADERAAAVAELAVTLGGEGGRSAGPAAAAAATGEDEVDPTSVYANELSPTDDGKKKKTPSTTSVIDPSFQRRYTALSVSIVRDDEGCFSCAPLKRAMVRGSERLGLLTIVSGAEHVNGTSSSGGSGSGSINLSRLPSPSASWSSTGSRPNPKVSAV